MNTINNNTGNVWASIGKGTVIGAATTTAATGLAIKTVVKKYPDRFISMVAEDAAKKGEVFNEELAKGALKFGSKFKNRLAIGLLVAAPVGAAVGAVLGGTVGAITKGVKSIVNHSKAKADNQAAQV